MSTMDVKVPIFVSPHLFWVINIENQTPLVLNHAIQQIWRPSDGQEFTIGEIVATKHKGKFYRAVVKTINDNDKFKKKYICWLLDYGLMIDTTTLCKLPGELQSLPAVAVQASLNNVAYLYKQLSYEGGTPAILDKPSADYNPSSRAIAAPLLRDTSIVFKKEGIVNGVLVGDLLYEQDDGRHSLRSSLCDKQTLVVDETLFTEILNGIEQFKETNIMSIHQICVQNNLLNARTGVEAYSKYLEGLEDKDLTEDDGRASITYSNRSSTGNTSESESQSHSHSESKDLSNDEKQRSSGRLQRTKVHDTLHEEDSFSSSNSDVPTGTRKQLNPHDRLAAVLRVKQAKTAKTDSESESTKTVQKTAPKVVITAGGTRMTNKRKTYQSGNESNQSIIHERSSSQDSKTHHRTQNKPNTRSQRSMADEDSASSCNTSSLNPIVMNLPSPCSCRQCKHWTNNLPQTELKIATEYKNTSKRVAMATYSKAPPFLKRPDTPVSKIIAFDYAKLGKIDKLRKPNVLLHGTTIPIPIHNVDDAGFNDDVHQNLKRLGYVITKKAQTYVWPSILRQQHTMVIHQPKSGKTFGYVPVLCSFLLDKYDYYKEFPHTGGPIAVILCRNSRKCSDVHKLINDLIKQQLTISSKRAKDKKNERMKTQNVLGTNPIIHLNCSSVDVLVTTPATFVALLYAQAINLKRLCHFVIDDADVIVRKHNKIIHNVINLIDEMIENRKTISRKVQLIMCAEHWNHQIQEIVRNLHETIFVCIPNCLEAALYGGIQFTVKFLQSAMKETEIKSLLKSRYHIFRTIIFCEDAEIKGLEETLMLDGIEYSIISTINTKEDNLLLEQSWKMDEPGKFRVLVITDVGFNAALVSIINANIVIHYSLPSNWTNFLKRFACVLENITSPLEEQKSPFQNESYILMDEKDVKKSRKLFRFFQELNVSLPADLNECYENYVQNEEQRRVERNISICEELKVFGKCASLNCIARHVLNADLDVNNVDLPRNGTVRFRIIEALDVTHFTAKLISCKDFNGNVKHAKIEEDITERLTDVMLEKEKMCLQKDPKLHYQYCYLNGDEGKYYRCEILAIKKSEEYDVKLLDIGTTASVNRPSLYKLPQRFRSMQNSVINIYLANFIPPLGDETFSCRSLGRLKKILEEHDFENVEFMAEIHLQLYDNLWVKNVYEEVVIEDVVACKFNLSTHMLNARIVEESVEPLNELYALCASSNIELPIYQAPVIEEVKVFHQIKAQWAHLEYEKANQVVFCVGFSPDEFYVRSFQFNSVLTQLEAEIQEAVARKIYHRSFEISAGKYCLAREADTGLYGRALIMKVEGTRALCFFVDFGDEIVVETEDLKYLSNYFILKLPFQCIRCSMYGLRPVLDEWDENATDILYKYATIPDSDESRPLFVKCYAKERTAVGQYSYKVVLKDGFGVKNVLINNLLIDCGTALNVDEEVVEDFEISSRKEIVIDDDEDLTEKEIEEIVKLMEEKEATELDCPYDLEDVGDFEVVVYDWLKLADQVFQQMEASEVPQLQPKPLKEVPAIAPPPNNEPSTPATKMIVNCGTAKSFVPTVKWTQTDRNIKLNIMLVDVENYTVSVARTRIFSFKATVSDKPYAITWVLYDRVESTVQHTSMGRQIRVVLTKRKEELWPRMLFTKEKVQNLQYDLETVQIEEEKPRRILTLPEEFGENIAGNSDDEDQLRYFDISDRESIYEEDIDMSSDQ